MKILSVWTFDKTALEYANLQANLQSNHTNNTTVANTKITGMDYKNTKQPIPARLVSNS